MTSSPDQPDLPDLADLPDLPAHRAAIETFVHLARLSMVTTDVTGQADVGLRRDLEQLAAEAGRRRPRREVAVALADLVLADLVLADLAADENAHGLLRQARDDLAHGRSPRSQR